MTKLWILCVALSACAGECDGANAARHVAAPGSYCVASNGWSKEAICVSRDRVETCVLDGIFFHVATCRVIGRLVDAPTEAR